MEGDPGRTKDENQRENIQAERAKDLYIFETHFYNMLTTIKGIYNLGEIILNEEPPVQTTTEVMVTFLTDKKAENKQDKRKLGGLEGKVTIPDDFNEPLEDLKDYM